MKLSFKALYPDIALSFVARPEPFDFAFERIDCAIHFGQADWPGAEVDYLFGETMVAVCDFSGLVSSICALARAAAIAPMVSLERCMGRLRLLENVEADRP